MRQGNVHTHALRGSGQCFGLRCAYAASSAVAEIERRVSAGDFSFLLPMDQAVAFLPAVQFSAAAQKKLQNGNPVEAALMLSGDTAEENTPVRLYCEKAFIGIGCFKDGVCHIRCRLGGN